MFCKQCGAECDEGQPFCHVCGANLQGQASIQAKSQSPLSDEQTSAAAYPKSQQPPHVDGQASASLNGPRRGPSMGLIVSLVSITVIVACLLVLVPRPSGNTKDDGASQVTVQALSLRDGRQSLLCFKETRVVAAGASDARSVANYLAVQLDGDTGTKDLGTPSARQGDDQTSYVFPQMIKGVPIYGREAVLTVNDDGQAMAMAASLEELPFDPDVDPEVEDYETSATLEELKPDAKLTLLGLYYLPLENDNQLAYLYDVKEPGVDASLIYALSARDGALLGTLNGSGEVDSSARFGDETDGLIELLVSDGLDGDAFSQKEAASLIDDACLGLPMDGDYDLLASLMRLLADDLEEGKAQRLAAALEADAINVIEAKEADATKLPTRFVELEDDLAADDDLTAAAFAGFPKEYIWAPIASFQSAEIVIEPDGSFTGRESAIDPNSSYRDPVFNTCTFEGRFSVAGALSDGGYELVLERLVMTSVEGEEHVDYGSRSISHASPVLGVLGAPTDEPRHGYALLPQGTPMASLSEGDREALEVLQPGMGYTELPSDGLRTTGTSSGYVLLAS